MTQIWVNIGSGNGLVPSDLLPEPMLTDCQWALEAFTEGNFTGDAQDIFVIDLKTTNLRLHIFVIDLKTTNLRLQLHIQEPVS